MNQWGPVAIISSGSLSLRHATARYFQNFEDAKIASDSIGNRSLRGRRSPVVIFRLSNACATWYDA